MTEQATGVSLEQVILYLFDLGKIALPILLTAYVSYRFGRKKKQTTTKEQLANHPVFVRIKGYRLNRISTINAGTQQKSELAQKYANVFLDTFEKTLNEVIKNASAEASTKTTDILEHLLKELERELECSGLFKILIEKLKVEHSYTYDEIFENLSELDQRTNINFLEKLDRAFYSFRSIVGLLMSGLGPRIAKMNGELEAALKECEDKKE